MPIPVAHKPETELLPTIDELLKQAVGRRASDIHLSSGNLVRLRIDGVLLELAELPKVSDSWLRQQLSSIMSTKLLRGYEETHEADFSHAVAGYGRFRVNAFQQRGALAAVFRVIPSKILTLEDLGAPPVFEDLANRKKGLILVTGPTGSGKSTTLTAIIDHINRTRREHIVTIEDPIEFTHESKLSLINQREVGEDTNSFAEALKRALRQDPDVLLVGELRDQETISTALTAAETGHLVFGTLHTQSAAKSIDRIVDSFPGAQQNQVRSQLSGTLQAVISQALVRKVGGGRIAANEIMIRTNAIANLIRKDDLGQLYSEIQMGTRHGMRTMDQHLKELATKGLVDKDEVMPLLTDKSALDGISLVRDSDWSS